MENIKKQSAKKWRDVWVATESNGVVKLEVNTTNELPVEHLLLEDLKKIERSRILDISKGKESMSFVEEFIKQLPVEKQIILFEKCAEWGNYNVVSYMIDKIEDSHIIFYNTGALPLAAEHGHRDVVLKLLEFGVNTEYPDREYGRRAMENAIIFGNIDIYDILYPYVDLNKLNENYDTYPQIMLKHLKENIECMFPEKNPKRLYEIFGKLICDTKENINNLNNDGESILDLLEENKNFFEDFYDTIEEKLIEYGFKIDKEDSKKINLECTSKKLTSLYLEVKDLEWKNDIFKKIENRLLLTEFNNTSKHFSILNRYILSH